MLIIQIRGTSGSGKTSVMRALLEATTLEGTHEVTGEKVDAHWESHYVSGRKAPLYYSHTVMKGALVLGHYEATCGGCDNVGSARAVYDLIRRLETPGEESPPARLILCEGLLLSEDTKWTLELSREHRVKVVFLTTSLDECLRRVEARRRAAGNIKPLNPENTSNRVAVIERARRKLTVAGVPCFRLPLNQAADTIAKWIVSEFK